MLIDLVSTRVSNASPHFDLCLSSYSINGYGIISKSDASYLPNHRIPSKTQIFVVLCLLEKQLLAMTWFGPKILQACITLVIDRTLLTGQSFIRKSFRPFQTLSKTRALICVCERLDLKPSLVKMNHQPPIQQNGLKRIYHHWK